MIRADRCLCRGAVRLFICQHPRNCQECGAFTTGARPIESGMCGPCDKKYHKRVHRDTDIPLGPELRRSVLEAASTAMSDIIEGAIYGD